MLKILNNAYLSHFSKYGTNKQSTYKLGNTFEWALCMALKYIRYKDIHGALGIEKHHRLARFPRWSSGIYLSAAKAHLALNGSNHMRTRKRLKELIALTL